MPKDFGCDTCPVRFGLKHHAKRHALVHTKPTCPVPGCGKVCQSDSHLERHGRVEHLGLREWACSQCPKAYAKRVDLRAHVARVHGEEPGESGGHSAATGQQQQPGHQEAANPTRNWARYACGYEDCQAAFPRYAELQAHIHQAHPIRCGQCGRSFTRRDVLADHLKTHEAHRDAAWMCPECPRRYLAKKNLSAHLKASHVAVKPFVCLFCGTSFGFKHVLERHVELLHADVHLSPAASSAGAVGDAGKAMAMSLPPATPGFIWDDGIVG